MAAPNPDLLASLFRSPSVPATRPTHVQPSWLCPALPSGSLPIREAAPVTTSGPSATLVYLLPACGGRRANSQLLAPPLSPLELEATGPRDDGTEHAAAGAAAVPAAAESRNTQLRLSC